MNRRSVVLIVAALAVVGVVFVAGRAKDKPGASWTLTSCKTFGGGSPTVEAAGTIKNLSNDEQSFNIQVTAYDGKFVVGVTDPVFVGPLRPGEGDSWRAGGLADQRHELPPYPRCEVDISAG